MQSTVVSVLISALLLASASGQDSAGVTIEPEFTVPETSAVVFSARKPLVLNCTVTKVDAATKVDVEWKKDDVLVTEVDSLKGRFEISSSGSRYTFAVKSADYHDAGNWTCSARVDGQVKASAQIHVVSTTKIRIKPDNINVVEEEKLRIECEVLGVPPPSLEWRIESENYNGSVTSNDVVQIKEYRTEKGVLIENGLLIIERVNKSDRGLYYCIGVNKFNDADRDQAEAIVRIKDKYAALWPFLGICAEVIILCAVIIIYEKKRNKTELEESDTDQSPDQKNTPDHGKDANLRHRQ